VDPARGVTTDHRVEVDDQRLHRPSAPGHDPAGFELSSAAVGKHIFAQPSLWSYFKLPYTWWGALGNMVDCVLEDGEPAISADDGLRVVAMTEATDRSIALRKPVSIASLLDEAGA
jgi:hypothetical protein